ncbi:Hypp4189 [Branchiostoma lanceolatum]|uniref:Hypp4189 protein n=1 Tax=Branchiostoma lanceolatum TaxID=7740 RepID=A0A8K0EUN6_BRALA|nr:Hypp4189 [Branchiostoma lanceolatum]
MTDQGVTSNWKRRRLEDLVDTPPPHGQVAGASPQTASQYQTPPPPVRHGINPSQYQTPPPPVRYGINPSQYQTPPPVRHGISPHNIVHPANYMNLPQHSYQMMTPHTAPQAWPHYGPSPLPQADHCFPQSQTVSLQAFKQMEEKLKAQLAKANSTIEKQDKELRDLKTCSQRNLDGVRNLVQSEMTSLVKKDSILAMNARTADDISALSPANMKERVEEKAPVLSSLLTACIKGDGMKEKDCAMEAFHTICSLANKRSQRANAMQLTLALSLIARSTNVQTIALMNSMGLSSSYRTAWTFIVEVAETQRMNLMLSSEESWLVFFDNINILKRIGHVRKGTQNEMFNWTSRLAVAIEYEDKSLSREPQVTYENLLLHG